MKNSDQIPIGCVILAAGNSVRFGRNKLFTEINGKTMIARAFASVPAEKLRGVVVVTQYEDVRNLAESFGFSSIVNSHPEWGLSHSVKLGTA